MLAQQCLPLSQHSACPDLQQSDCTTGTRGPATGKGCTQAKQGGCSVQVVYGLDFVAADRAAQHAALQQAILDHVQRYPQALLVIEEYDKMSCQTRGFLRQVIENSGTANVSLARHALVSQHLQQRGSA